jgi:hypothetical protein
VPGCVILRGGVKQEGLAGERERREGMEEEKQQQKEDDEKAAEAVEDRDLQHFLPSPPSPQVE